MKVSDHPAARSRAQQQPPDPGMLQPENIGDVELPAIQQLQGEPADWQPPEPEPGETGTGDVPLPTRDPIVTAPRDGRDVRVYWGTEDETGRLARWHEGRRFDGRRWVIGGSWIPADGLALGMIPLPAAEPTEWLHDPGADPPPDAGEDAEQAAA